MKVYIEKEEKELNLDFEGKAVELLKQLDINPETIVIIKNNELITQEDSINNEDEIKFLSVISGG